MNAIVRIGRCEGIDSFFFCFQLLENALKCLISGGEDKREALGIQYL